MPIVLLLSALLFFGSAPAMSLAAQNDDDALKKLEAEVERLQENARRMRADREAFRIGGFSADGRYSGSCEMSMDLHHYVPGFEVVNSLSGIAEVTNGNITSLVRFSFDEVEYGKARWTKVTFDGACQDPKLRIMRVEFCQLDRKIYGDCGVYIRTTAPISIAPQAAK